VSHMHMLSTPAACMCQTIQNAHAVGQLPPTAPWPANLQNSYSEYGRHVDQSAAGIPWLRIVAGPTGHSGPSVGKGWSPTSSRPATSKDTPWKYIFNFFYFALLL
jgi:hypothetical protein